jgi:hypothetical protein
MDKVMINTKIELTTNPFSRSTRLQPALPCALNPPVAHVAADKAGS